MAESPDALGPITAAEIETLETLLKAKGRRSGVLSAFGDQRVLHDFAPRLLAALRTAQQERDEQITRLANCYRLTGADPDGNTDAALAVHAELEVKCLRHDLDVAGEDHDKLQAQLTAGLSAKEQAERQLKELQQWTTEQLAQARADAVGTRGTLKASLAVRQATLRSVLAALPSDPTPTQDETT